MEVIIIERQSNFREDLRGMRFGNLVPIRWLRGGMWECLCDCGNKTIVDTRNLKSGHTTSCGCQRRTSKNFVDMTGYENEHLVVLNKAGSVGNVAYWECQCKRCGRLFVTRGSNIRFGYTKSCGCLKSINEEKICRLLDLYEIEYRREYSFSDLIGVGGRRLRFDFAIFNNAELMFLLEFNGSQHYARASRSWASNYDNQIENDRRKAEYCMRKGIPLKIISYKDEYDIFDILD